MIVLIVGAIFGGKKEEPQEIIPNQDVTEDVSAESTETVEEENPLEVDAYAGINELVLKYFNGLSSGNTEMVEETVDVITDEEKMTIQKKKDYIEAYNNVICYTKKGLEDHSYVVFASYEMKIYNIETAAPGIMALYVCTGEDGSLYIFNGDAPEELENYVLELAAEEDVATVIAEVDARYQQLLEADKDLGNFAQTMLESQETAEEDIQAETPAQGEGKELENPVVTTVNDGIRIRESRSTESRMIATVANGTEVKVYANFEDGWSKIEYSGTVGYCKSEFLTSTEGVPMLSTEGTEPTEEEAESSREIPGADETTSTIATDSATATSVNKTMELTDAIRIRKEASTDSEIVARGYTNELVKVLENLDNGWSKIEYNGTTGYCKTEFLREAD